jgi:SAM-dependent MidA family methyltransferase
MLRFDRYMQAVLYEPGLGYYMAGQQRFGAAGDFVTAPELSPMFGRCLAVQCAQWFETGAPAVIWEFGAGSGALAEQLIGALDASGRTDLEYRIIELSPELKLRQQARLSNALPARLRERIVWLDHLPDAIEGVVVANELLDALPVRLFDWADGTVFERHVAVHTDGFQWQSVPAEADFERIVRQRLTASGWPLEAFESGYCSEVGEQAGAWLRSVGERLRRGALLLIDYGFPAREFYHPQRRTGTLNCHYRHRSHADPFWWPGLCDVTAHVDFSLLLERSREIQLELLGYTSQAQFLLACGLLEQFERALPAGSLDRARSAQAVQQLVSEAEMGELFKVIAFGRGLSGAGPGFSLRDRSAAL